MESFYVDFMRTQNIRIAAPMVVRSLRDLLKLLMDRESASPNHLMNPAVYCKVYKEKFIYFTMIKAENVLFYRGLILIYYIALDMEPEEWLWWNIKTNVVRASKIIEPSTPEEKDATLVFPIIVLLENPEWIDVWKEA